MTSTPRESVGLVGTGLLGTVLAERLLAAGHDVHARDRDDSRRGPIEALGGTWTNDVAALPARCRRIVLCLPDSDVVATVVESLEPHLQPGTVVVDTTTGDPQITTALAVRLAARDVTLVDACVLGSSEQVRAGEAMLLVGGNLDGHGDVTELLRAICGDVRHVGPVGSGQRMKLVANLVLGLNRAALAEGLALAESFGFDPGLALGVLHDGVTYSRVMEVKGPKMVRRDYAPAARLRQHLKDVRLILEAAERTGQPLPLSERHRLLLERAVALGHADDDNAAIVESWRHPE